MKKDDVLNILSAMKKSYMALGIPDPEAVEALEWAINAVKAEPCEDAVSRQAVLESIKNLYPDMPVVDIMGSRRKWLDKYAPYFECENAVEHLPSVNPQPKTGHWINVNEGKWNTIPAYKCSACGANADLRDWSGESPFCPWCGAKMFEPPEREG